MTESPQITRAVINNLIVEMRNAGLDTISVDELQLIVDRCTRELAAKARR